MNPKTAKIKDVARIAGVSTATVSRALSEPGKVAEATRALVLDAVAATGYRANQAARNLRRRRSGSIIALVPNLANPFFSQIMAGISSVLAPSGYGLLIADTRSGPDADGRLAHYLSGNIADGLILLDGALSPQPLAHRPRPPVIAACEWLGDLPSIRAENARGAELAVRHLAGAGHRRIGHLAGPAGNVLSMSRADGMVETLAALGLERRAEWVFEGDFSLASGARAAALWMAMADRPTGLFCASDEMACGFIGALQQSGIEVPGEVSVIGFDDIEVAAHLGPPLTTIHQPRFEIGAHAARSLLAMIKAGTLEAETEVLPVELVERGSVAPPPGAAPGPGS
ncbi:LacI family DNA-binding transcriptional regulator [Limimaricola sp.]|uniref:LacI family DNA-binding transcriptional regulator n=1 Tax=Limimaricola sp. TaxID=2211665 RepID=UPI004058DF81